MPAFNTDSLQKFLTPEGTLVFTLTSNGYKFMTLNLIRHIQELRAPWRLAVFCADAASYTFFTREGIGAIRLADPVPDHGPNVVPMGTRQFQGLNRKKLDVLDTLCNSEAVKQAVYLDGDIAVYRDFVPDIEARLAGHDGLLMQCDEQTRVDCSGTPCPNLCTGVIAWRHGTIPSNFFSLADSEALAAWRERSEDQVWVNRRIAELGVPASSLPRTLYPNGAFAGLYGRDSGLKKGRLSSFLLHYNYLIGEAKKRRMTANGDWIIPY
jgi:hypothetical protein